MAVCGIVLFGRLFWIGIGTRGSGVPRRRFMFMAKRTREKAQR